MTKIKLWLLEKVFNWCEPDLCRNIECGVLESFYAELHALRMFMKKGTKQK